MAKIDDKLLLELLLKSNKIEFQKEFKFHLKRKWKFDYILTGHKIAIEVEGGNWTGGRHVTGKGYEDDIEKYNAGLLMGWKILRYTPNMIKKLKEKIIDDIIELIGDLKCE